MAVAWFPEGLNSAIARGFTASLPVAALDATQHSGSHEAIAIVAQTSPTTAALKAAGRLGAIFEEGARPHPIEGKRGFLYIGDGRFVSGTVHHPGSPAKPYLGPAGVRWAGGGFQRTAHAVLGSAGYG